MDDGIPKKELTFKFVVIGNIGVGKTCILRKYTKGVFSENYRLTIGADFGIKTLEWDESTRIHLHIWDIAGSDRFQYVTSACYKYANGAILVFDLTRPETFISTDEWLSEFRLKVGEKVPVVLLANKGDIRRDSVPEEIDKYCQEKNILNWFITSAKENINIDEAMLALTQEALKNHLLLEDDEIDDKISVIDLEKKPITNGRRCC